MQYKPKLYFASIDIKKSFDTINQLKLYEIIQKLFTQVNFFIINK